MEPQLGRGDNTTGQISMNIRDLEDEFRVTTLSNKRKLPLLKSETWLSGQNVTASIFIKHNIRQTRCIWRTHRDACWYWPVVLYPPDHNILRLWLRVLGWNQRRLPRTCRRIGGCSKEASRYDCKTSRLGRSSYTSLFCFLMFFSWQNQCIDII